MEGKRLALSALETYVKSENRQAWDMLLATLGTIKNVAVSLLTTLSST
jgi:hypothetical protein